MKQILFYRTKDEYGCFSNFSKHTVKIDNKEWPTSEHYFQAQKFLDEELQEMVRNANGPMSAAKMGRDINNPLREDWELVKDGIMRTAVREKFRQNFNIQRVLMSTDNFELIEHTKNDAYWGDGGDGSGKNMLGKILMETRDKIEEEGARWAREMF